MKLKTVLKSVIDPHYTITVQTNGKFKDYHVNYTAKKFGIAYDSDTVMKCDCKVYLPKEILDREVTYIGINRANQTLHIDCFEKERR